MFEKIQTRVALSTDGYKIIGKDRFDLRKQVSHVGNALGHAAPVRLESIAVKSHVPEAAIQGQGRRQGFIE